MACTPPPALVHAQGTALASPAVRPAPRRPPLVLHPDYGNLRKYHNYYRVISVGDFKHHFTAFFHHHELAVASYDAPARPGAPVRFIGSGFGLITTRPAAVPIAPEAAPLVEAVRRDVRARGEAGADITVFPLGTYREVHIEEIVGQDSTPFNPSDPTGGRTLFVVHYTLAASEDLTAILPPIRFHTHGSSSMRTDEDAESTEGVLSVAPQWIDVRLGRQGKAQLWKAMNEPAMYEPARVQAFQRRDAGGGSTLA